MADIADWGTFIRGRWDWRSHGFDRGFPRGCTFTDVDAAVEFDGRALVIEAKHWDGISARPELSTGQQLYLRDEVLRGKTALVVFGCGPCGDPVACLQVGLYRDRDVWHLWSELPKVERRARLKRLIDEAMGIRNGHRTGGQLELLEGGAEVVPL